MELYAYIGCPIDRETAERDYVAFGVLGIMELEVRFPQRGKHTREQVEAGLTYASIRMTRELYGREISFKEARREIELTEQAEADFRAGVPADESEAAMFFRSLFTQYPRLKIESDSMAAYLGGADARTL